MIKVRVQDADQVKVGVGSDVVQVMNNNYNELENKPQINSVTLQGNKDGNDLGLANLDDIPSLEGYATEEWVESQGYLTEHQSLANYYTKGQTDDLLDAKADETDLVEHTSNTTIHVTSGDKSAWNAKYDKPNGGIPKNDLSASVQSSLGKADTAIQEHQSLANYSTTAQMNQAINAHHDATKQDVLTSQTAYTQKGTATKVPQITTNSLGQVTAISEVNIDKTTLSDLGITATASEINVLDGITASTAELNYTDGVTSNIQTQLNNKEDADATILKQADVVNNTSSTVTNKPLSANMGKALQDSINNLKSIGRFLAIWNASTGRPTSEPTVSPYVYKTGDYYRIGTVGNKIPTGSQYVIDGTNWTTTTDTLAVGDVYYYDGTSWVRQASSGGGTVQDVQVEGTSVLTGGVANVQLSDFGINATASELNYMDGVTSNVQTQLNAKYDASNPSGFVTSSYHDATKQDVIDSAHKLDYSLLSNTPTIPVVPTNVSAFTNDAGYLTEHQSLANYYTKSETDSEISGHHDSTKQNVIDSAHKLDYSLIDNQPTIPSKTSQLTNDSGFLTEHQSLADYSTTTQMNTAISNHHDSTKYDASNPSGYTSNTGTVTSVGVKMNGATKGTVTTSGTIDLGTVLTSHQDISGKENISNKVTSVNSSSTDTQYPSAKCLYDDYITTSGTSVGTTIPVDADTLEGHSADYFATKDFVKNSGKKYPNTGLFSGSAGGAFGTALSLDTYTQQSLRNVSCFEKLLYQNGNPFNSIENCFLALYVDNNNYIGIKVAWYELLAEVKIGGTVLASQIITTSTTPSFYTMYNTHTFRSRIDFGMKKIEMWCKSTAGVLTKMIDLDFSSVDISTFTNFKIKTGIGGRHEGHQACKYIRINSYFNDDQYLDYKLRYGNYGTMTPTGYNYSYGYAPTELWLGGTITQTITPLHKITNMNNASMTYFKIAPYNNSIPNSARYPSLAVRAKFSNMSDNFKIREADVCNRAAVVNSSGEVVFYFGLSGETSINAGGIKPNADEWYWIYVEGKGAQSISYYSTYTIYVQGSATIEVDATDGMIACQKSTSLCFDTYNGSYFLGNIPFQCDEVPYFDGSNFTTSQLLSPIGATTVDSNGIIYMYNGAVWKQIANA